MGIILYKIDNNYVYGVSQIRIRLAPLLNFGNFLYPTLPVSFGRGTKAFVPFYLVSMPEEVKDHTRGKCVICRGLHILPSR